MNKAIIVGRLLLTTCHQGAGAPFIDSASSKTVNGSSFKSIAVLLYPWKRNKYLESLPQLSLVIGWRKR